MTADRVPDAGNSLRWLGFVALACSSLKSPRAADAPRAPFQALIVAGGGDGATCFEHDAAAAEQALSTSSILRLGPDDRKQLTAALANTREPLLAYYAGHGMTGRNGETIGASAWLLGGRDQATPIGSLLESARSPAWLVLLSASCYSAWTDVSRASVPASIISTSAEVTYDEPTVPDPSRTRACSAPSTLGTLLAEALAGAADVDADCLVADEELARYVNQRTQDWPTTRRPSLHVSRNATQALPVARAPNARCLTHLARWRERASELQGPLRESFFEQLDLARGLTIKLPSSSARYYVTTSSSHELEQAAKRRGLAPFPATLAVARELAPVARFTKIFELTLQEGRLDAKELTTGEASTRPVSTPSELEAALPGCGTVESVQGSALHVRFDGSPPAHRVSARGVRFRAREGAPIPCGALVGNCFRVSVPAEQKVYEGDPIDCSPPEDER